ncbi:spore coat protein U domain-containing protein [Breoghania sp.]|uniref:spore coat protein U domain-containing protein n=1 Tax=Breoghania sp. TaxID=2065378 RepID=UPI0026270F21|nr:spore coat protein U domain-containing protein [Breoghania sp.]MDJ0932317.1 spore coat protein U domain-containing protein [Breoghania sp.]
MARSLLWGLALALCVWFSLPSAPAAVATCTISYATLAFGAVDTLSSSSNATTTDITVSCSDISNSTVSACVNLGSGPEGTADSLRLMSSSSDELEYGLYQDEPGSTAWGGVTTSGLGDAKSLTLTASSGSASEDITIYGERCRASRKRSRRVAIRQPSP